MMAFLFWKNKKKTKKEKQLFQGLSPQVIVTLITAFRPYYTTSSSTILWLAVLYYGYQTEFDFELQDLPF